MIAALLCCIQFFKKYFTYAFIYIYSIDWLPHTKENVNAISVTFPLIYFFECIGIPYMFTENVYYDKSSKWIPQKSRNKCVHMAVLFEISNMPCLFECHWFIRSAPFLFIPCFFSFLLFMISMKSYSTQLIPIF